MNDAQPSEDTPRWLKRLKQDYLAAAEKRPEEPQDL